MTYPWPTLMPMGIVVISCVRPSVQPSMGLGLCIAYKALGRNGLQFGISVRLSNHLGLFFFLLFFCFFFSKVRVGAKEGGSHYWEMAVAITCGYCCHYWQHILVWYLLPLRVAGMSEYSHLFEFRIMCCMLSTFHVSSRIVANISESSLLLSQ